MTSPGSIEKKRWLPYNGGEFFDQDVKPMNSTQIRCFLEAARLRSFSRAAEALYLTQPSVSRYIGQLEQEWEVRLFDRSGKAVALTPQGEDYYRLCLHCQAEFDALKDKHRAQSDQTALSLQYSIFPAWNISKLLYENMEYVKGHHPDWDISLKICQAGALVEELRRGGVDLIFTVGGVLRDETDLETRTLLELPQIILYSRLSPLAQKSDLTPRDFADETFLFVPDAVLTTEMIRRQVRSMEKRYGFAMKTRLLTNTDELSLELELGQGVALMDYWTRYKNNSALRCLAIDLAIDVVLAWKKENANPALPRFAQDTADFFRRQVLE